MSDKTDQLNKVAQPVLDRQIDIDIATSCLNPVFGEGSVDAELMFVGEAPGKAEDEQGRPFVGASGKFLEEMLESIGYKRDDVYIRSRANPLRRHLQIRFSWSQYAI